MARPLREVQSSEIEVSVVMPCLDEEDSIGYCVEAAMDALDSMGVSYEVVISDNGSTDRSVEIAESLGARVVHQPIRGYGNAYHKGIGAARGEYVVMADSDGTYPFSEIPVFVEALRGGADMVMGSRFKGSIEPGSMPWLHRYVGNPVLTWILNVLFRTGISDAHCGMRGFTREAYARLGLRTAGMEYASEMVIQAGRKNLDIEEVPITLSPRIGGDVKLNTWTDGWRHLRFMLLQAPGWVLLLPGVVLSILGGVIVLVTAFGPLRIGSVLFDVNTLVFGALMTVLGVQTALLGLTTKLYARSRNLDDSNGMINAFDQWFTFERGLIVGGIVVGIGLIPGVYLAVQRVSGVEFGDADFRLSVLALIFTVIGFQIIFQSLFASMLGVKDLATEAA